MIPCLTGLGDGEVDVLWAAFHLGHGQDKGYPETRGFTGMGELGVFRDDCPLVSQVIDNKMDVGLGVVLIGRGPAHDNLLNRREMIADIVGLQETEDRTEAPFHVVEPAELRGMGA